MTNLAKHSKASSTILTESCTESIRIKLAPFTKVSGRVGFGTVRVQCNGRITPSTRANGSTTKRAATEHFTTLMVTSTKGNGRTTSAMGGASTRMCLEQSTTVNGRTTNNTARVARRGPKVRLMKANIT